jgi:hypothetical protein
MSDIIALLHLDLCIICTGTDWLRAERSEDRISVGTGFSAPVQTGRGVHPASYAMDSGSLSGLKRPRRGVDHPPHLALRLKEE